jgi:ParB-like chromosome segregation protein Spo0J
MREFNRQALTGAPYNPRRIDEAAKKKLRDNLKRVGLLQPIVVNIRDARNRIISGHKRIELLDSLEGRQDYLLECAVVDLDDKTEKEQVVFFNNEQAMGTYDEPLLTALLSSADKDKPSFENMGFDLSYLKVTLPSFEAPATPARESQEAAVLQTAQEIEKTHEEEVAAIKEAKKKGKEAADRRYVEDKNVEFFTVVIFRDRASSDRFADRLRVNRSEKYVSGDLVMQVIDREVAEPGTEAWIPLSEIFGTGRVPETVATILKGALAKMQNKGDVGEKNRFQALEYMATEYLNDPNHA